MVYTADDGQTAAAQPNKEEEAAGSSSDYGKAVAKLKDGEKKKRAPKVRIGKILSGLDLASLVYTAL